MNPLIEAITHFQSQAANARATAPTAESAWQSDFGDLVAVPAAMEAADQPEPADDLSDLHEMMQGWFGEPSEPVATTEAAAPTEDSAPDTSWMLSLRV